jgi:hypothetical protein
MAKITKRSLISDKTRTLNIPQYSTEEFERLLIAYEKGLMSIDEAFPLVSDKAKLFIETGTIEEEWDGITGRL